MSSSCLRRSSSSHVVSIGSPFGPIARGGCGLGFTVELWEYVALKAVSSFNECTLLVGQRNLRRRAVALKSSHRNELGSCAAIAPAPTSLMPGLPDMSKKRKRLAYSRISASWTASRSPQPSLLQSSLLAWPSSSVKTPVYNSNATCKSALWAKGVAARAIESRSTVEGAPRGTEHVPITCSCQWTTRSESTRSLLRSIQVFSRLRMELASVFWTVSQPRAQSSLRSAPTTVPSRSHTSVAGCA